MPYEPLAKLFHMDTSNSRFSENERLAKLRLEADSTFRTGIVTPSGELFLAVPRDLSVINEKVLRLERLVSKKLSLLPPVARGALIRGLVTDEIVCTNDLEGIHSTRRQISDILESTSIPDDPLKEKRFRELAKMYLNLSDQNRQYPTSPEDVRAIYDKVMRGEPMEESDRPDGKLFRRGEVEVIGAGSRVLHHGVYPESEIILTIGKMLSLADSADIPQTYSAILSHYVFEYVHPFYDGNGRTGRYLLALYLSRPLSVLTSLSLSRLIAENRDAYYRSFRVAEDKLNHGELTFFVMNILEDVRVAQSQLVVSLSEKEDQLDEVTLRLGGFSAQFDLSEKDKEIIYMLVQLDLFAPFPGAGLPEVSRHLGMSDQQTRKYLKRLQDLELVQTSSKRPLRFLLTRRTETYFGLNPVEMSSEDREI